MCLWATACIWRSEDKCCNWILCFYHMHPGDRTQVLRLAGKHLQPARASGDPCFDFRDNRDKSIMYPRLATNSPFPWTPDAPDSASQVLGLQAWVIIPDFIRNLLCITLICFFSFNNTWDTLDVRNIEESGNFVGMKNVNVKIILDGTFRTNWLINNF